MRLMTFWGSPYYAIRHWHHPTRQTAIALVGDENGFGRMTYGFRGGIDTSRTDVNDGDVVDA
jgi:hypothetical protein